jgi:hypothetical protein
MFQIVFQRKKTQEAKSSGDKNLKKSKQSKKGVKNGSAKKSLQVKLAQE